VLSTDILGATGKTYTFRPTAAQDNHRSRAIFTNVAGTAMTQPVAQTVVAGQTSTSASAATAFSRR
jgi:hypothetical protein